MLFKVIIKKNNNDKVAIIGDKIRVEDKAGLEKYNRLFKRIDSIN